ncbi:MAG: YeiH family protein, partial [Burkholderiaceae bacterium]|nr:YeiH family protein [Burkholderiaceae bacterium]
MIQGCLPGLLLTGALTALAAWLAQWSLFARHGISALTLAIVLGMIVGNWGLKMVQGSCAKGIGFSRHWLLRLGIILFGLRLTLQDIRHVGWMGVLIDVIMLGSTFLLAVYIGTRWLRLDRDTAMLVGSGSSICGAAAVLATEPVLRAPGEKVAMAVATVVVYGTLGMFVYPVLYHLTGRALGMTLVQYGIYAGSTIHEVAQVVGAARTVSAQSADVAVVTKMVRVMLLAPFLVVLSFWISRSHTKVADELEQTPLGKKSGSITIPWFAVGFVAVALLHSAVALPATLANGFNTFDTIVLSMAMAALGLGTHVSQNHVAITGQRLGALHRRGRNAHP